MNCSAQVLDIVVATCYISLLYCVVLALSSRYKLLCTRKGMLFVRYRTLSLLWFIDIDSMLHFKSSLLVRWKLSLLHTA